jgi:hypothetical protein
LHLRSEAIEDWLTSKLIFVNRLPIQQPELNIILPLRHPTNQQLEFPIAGGD